MATAMGTAKPITEFTKTDKDLTMTTILGDKSFSNTLVFGKEAKVSLAGFEYLVRKKIRDLISGF